MDLMNNLPVEDKQEIDDSMGIIQLICGEVNHRAFWSYVSMYPSKYVEYAEKVDAHEDVNIEEYGIVIDKGWGERPPQDVQDKMKVHFGADNNFQEDFIKAGEKLMEDLEKLKATDTDTVN